MSEIQRAKILVFGNQKGGVGKTTLSVGVAGAWAESVKRKILFIDADPQRSASEQLRDHPHVSFVNHDGGNLDVILPDIMADYNFIIIDTPAGVNEALYSAVHVADLLVIPVKPSPYDFMSAERTLQLARVTNIPAVFVINEYDARTRFAKQAREALSAYDAHVLTQFIGYRSAHREAAASGKSITDVSLNGGKAATEIRQLSRELLTILGG